MVTTTILCDYLILQAPLTASDSPSRLYHAIHYRHPVPEGILKCGSGHLVPLGDGCYSHRLQADHRLNRHGLSATRGPKVAGRPGFLAPVVRGPPTHCGCHLAVRYEHSTPRFYVPQPFCRAVFDALHYLSHPGIRATQCLVTARYVWPRINADVRKCTRSCLQGAAAHRHLSWYLCTA